MTGRDICRLLVVILIRGQQYLKLSSELSTFIYIDYIRGKLGGRDRLPAVGHYKYSRSNPKYKESQHFRTVFSTKMPIGSIENCN
jgi:hypothetical protein